MTRLGVSFAACLLALPLPAVAQDLAISGTVADQTGGVLPGVTVEAAGPGLADRSRVAVTDGEGRYVLDGLPAGDYSVSFSLAGFETAHRDGVSLAGPDGAALDVVLQFASFSNEVTVVGSKLDTGRQEFGTSVAYMGEERLESDAIFTVEDASVHHFAPIRRADLLAQDGVVSRGVDVSTPRATTPSGSAARASSRMGWAASRRSTGRPACWRRSISSAFSDARSGP